MSDVFVGETILFSAGFKASGLGATGLTVTVDVRRNGVEIVTGASAVEDGDGLYSYDLAGASNNAAGRYSAIFKTAGVADQQHQFSHFISRTAMGPLAANSITAAATAADFGTEIEAAINAPTAAEIAAAVEAALTIPTTAEIAAAVLLEGVTGTTSGVPTTTSIPTTGSDLSASDDLYINAFLVITSGALKGVARKITDYVGASKTFTTQAFPSAPAPGVSVMVVGNVPSA